MSVAAIEEKLDQAEREVDKLKMNIKQYEGLVEEYRSQVSVLLKLLFGKLNIKVLSELLFDK